MIFTDFVMFVLCLILALAMLGMTIRLLVSREGDWWWTLGATVPSGALTYYYFLLWLDPAYPEAGVPPLLQSLFRPALAWLIVVVVLYVLHIPFLDLFRRRPNDIE